MPSCAGKAEEDEYEYYEVEEYDIALEDVSDAQPVVTHEFTIKLVNKDELSADYTKSTCQNTEMEDLNVRNTKEAQNLDLKTLLEVPAELIQKEKEVARLGHEKQVWVPDRKHGYRICRVVDEDYEKGIVTLEPKEHFFNDDTSTNAITSRYTVDKKCVQPMSQSHFCSNMCSLTELNEASLLHTVRCRYQQQLIHTYSGPFCVVVNPWKNMPQLYSSEMINFYASDQNRLQKETDSPPHIYSVAQNAYSQLSISSTVFRNKINQSILITGESGAGKTENTKKIIEYLVYLANQRYAKSDCSNQKNTNKELDSAIINANIALEAFANAKTIHNSNSSRFGKFIQIDFNKHGSIHSARINCYLLEKSRIVSQNVGDRNFHIFYQLLANENFLASSNKHLNAIYGTNCKCRRSRATDFRFLNQGIAKEGDIHDKFVDDLSAGHEIEVALNSLGFTSEEKAWIREITLACALIGEIRFGERQGFDISFVEEMEEMDTVSQLLGLGQNATNAGRLVDALTQPSIRVGDSLIRKGQCLRKTQFSAAALAKSIYERLFKWIVSRCNEAIEQRESVSNKARGDETNFIGVLDMAGFEIVAQNSFEQLCINYTNERLQQFFNEFMFVQEQREYFTEGIVWNQENFGTDLQPTIDLIEKPLGLLSLVQEECIVPNGNDSSLLEKLIRTLAVPSANADSSPIFTVMKQSTRNIAVNHFTITHYAGQVCYNIDGWLEKNRDVVDPYYFDTFKNNSNPAISGIQVLALSEHPLVSRLFSAEAPNVPAGVNGSPHRGKGILSMASTISYVYREQLSNLMKTLNSTTPHFIRCIVPNYNRIPFVFEGPLVLHQLRCNGVLEGIRICRRGYPNRIQFPEFIRRYGILATANVLGNDDSDAKSLARHLCQQLEIDDDRIQIGNTKVFCRVGVLSELESRRKEKISQLIAQLQAWIRWYLQQRLVKKRLSEWQSTVQIQNNIRRRIGVNEWQWYKLWLHVRQLIPLFRERKLLEEYKERCSELEKANQVLSTKVEQLQHSEHSLELKIQKIEAQCENEQKCADELRSELRRNEELLELMEKKFDDQHAKVMRLNATLKDNSRSLERIEEEKKGLQFELNNMHERFKTEEIEREAARANMSLLQEENERLTNDIAGVRSVLDRLQGEMAAKNSEICEWQEKYHSQEQNVSELNMMLCDSNDKVNALQTQLRKERTARQKAEAEVDELETETQRISEDLDKANAQRGTLKEQLRLKDIQISKLQRRLDDKTTEMEDCVAELKKIHKNLQADLSNQLDDWRRKSLKLETENAQLKCKVEATQVLSQYSQFSLERDSSADDLDRGERFGSCSVMSKSFSGRSYCPSVSSNNPGTYYGSLNRRRKTLGGELPEKVSGLSRSSSQVDTEIGPPSHHYLSRQNTINNMTTSLTSTIDSGLTRCSSTTSATGSQLNLKHVVGVSGSTYQINQKLDASERKNAILERELHSLKQDNQLIKRELEVYKQSLQESERAKENFAKQVKSVNAELDKLSTALKTEEERSQTFSFESRKSASEILMWQQKYRENKDEAEVELAEERKKFQTKLSELEYEHNTRIRQVTNSQKNTEFLQEKLTKSQFELDKALGQIAQLERLQKSQNAIGETWESQYRVAQQDLQSLRDENAALKSKIRRQYKQIELLTQQSEIDNYVSNLENEMEKVQDRFSVARASAKDDGEGRQEASLDASPKKENERSISRQQFQNF